MPAAPARALVLLRVNGKAADWRHVLWYGGCGLLFFAADAFGGELFAIKRDEAARFDPETGTDEPMAATLEGQAAAIPRVKA